MSRDHDHDDENPFDGLDGLIEQLLDKVASHEFDAGSENCRSCPSFDRCKVKFGGEAASAASETSAASAPLPDEVASVVSDVAKALGVDPKTVRVVPMGAPPVAPLSLRPPPLSPDEFQAIVASPTHGVASLLLGRLVDRREQGMPVEDFEMGVDAIRYMLKDRMQ